jgi:hypothetical protein
MRGCLSALCLFSLLPACRVAQVTPTPVAGEIPSTVVVWPHLAATTPIADAAEVLLPLDGALRRRGYQVPSTVVTQRLLADRGHLAVAPDVAALQMLAELVGAEAMVVVEVRLLQVDGEPPRNARWDLSWRLLAVSDSDPVRLVERWSHTHHGAWRQAEADPLAPEPFERDDGTSFPAHRGAGMPNYRNVRELFASLHRMAMDHLPVRPR